MESTADRLREASGKVGSLLALALATTAGIAVVTQLDDFSAKKGAAVLLFLAFLGAAIVTRRPKEIFLFGCIFSFTYNRQFFVFEGLAGSHGMQGPHLIAADVFLVGLFGLWLYQTAVLKRPSRPQGPAIWPWFLPYVAACLLSFFAAVRLDWSLFELMRLGRVAMILFYVRYNVGAREWWICLIALGCGVSVQSLLGSLEVAFNRTGVLWLIGLGRDEVVVPEMLQAANFYGWTRAQATMNHPPNLACYLLLLLPALVALGLTHARRYGRLLSGLAAMIGMVGLACTLSRWPWALAVIQITCLLIGLALLRTLAVRRTLAVLILGAFVASSVGLAMSDFIWSRMTRDWKESIDQRLGGQRTALSMFRDVNPFLGVGLNNYRHYFLKYEPDQVWMEKYEPLAVMTNVRFVAAPQNGFLFVLAETGVIGLAAFLIYLAGVARAGLRAIAITSGHRRAAVFGLVIGFAGVLAHQAIDYTFFVDPILYTGAFVVALLNNAVVLAPPALVQAPAGAERQREELTHV